MPPSPQSPVAIDRPWVDLFEDRYGAGSLARLLEQLDQPCVSFAAIAAQFGVTRERVRQWHLKLRPGAPRGHQRRRLCLRRQQKRTLLTDGVFRTFYRHARSQIAPQHFSLIPARGGYRRRSLRLFGQLVSIRVARAVRDERRGTVAYVLSPRGSAVGYLYYQLTPKLYLFLPAAMLPEYGTMFVNGTRSKYWSYLNTFAAAQPEPATVADAGRREDQRERGSALSR